MSELVVQVVEDGKVVASQPLPADNYIVVCGAERMVTHEQHYPTKGTVIVTIKRLAGTEGNDDDND